MFPILRNDISKNIDVDAEVVAKSIMEKVSSAASVVGRVETGVAVGTGVVVKATKGYWATGTGFFTSCGLSLLT